MKPTDFELTLEKCYNTYEFERFQYNMFGYSDQEALADTLERIHLNRTVYDLFLDVITQVHIYAYVDYAGMSEMTGLAIVTLRNYAAKDKLPVPAIYFGKGRFPLWKKSDITEWMESRGGRGRSNV